MRKSMLFLAGIVSIEATARCGAQTRVVTPLARKLNILTSRRPISSFSPALRSSSIQDTRNPSRSSVVNTDHFQDEIRRWVAEKRFEFEQRGESPAGDDKVPEVPAMIFDIDGVFKMGGKYADFGAEALRKVIEAGLPYVLMTNGGGGRTEDEYAAEINSKLYSVEKNKLTKKRIDYVGEDQMVLSYTPFNTDFAHLKDKSVLVVGSPRCEDLAKHYGFKKAMHLTRYSCKHPLMNPFGPSGCEKDDCVVETGPELWDENFEAVLVFTDPSNFFEGIQLITDVLLSSRPGEVEFEPDRRIPVVFSNPDLLWKTQYPHARFGQGAFRLSLEACYRARLQQFGMSPQEVEERLGDFVQYGKPEITQFSHSRRAAMKQANDMGVKISHYYMVGDNPLSDIQGAINMNEMAERKGTEGWSGLLVKTGIYKDGEDTKGADLITDNVLDAVDHVLQAHGDDIEHSKRHRDSKKRFATR
eukprot:CAMPEP_0170172240 /NCGR_PEP_ID=MMETSP0040_2-20121228/5479_1 /TAXON_ID=641309 /ORGANISM="Lotharella oceanica, Strain CCMP622" /LENGTH=471 /DNA_ID=CAMNT_0010412803 /DNA_START=50 /DNA_END=1465 /DNA_ORIENTATION=+